MRRLTALAMCGLSLALIARADGPAAVLVVYLKPAVTVVDPVITIGDVAVLADGSPKLHEAIANLDLVELGAIEATMISREQISIRIQLAGFDSQKFRVTGAAQAEVILDRSQVTEGSLVAAARQAVRRRLPGKTPSLKLARPVTVPELVRKPGDHVYLAADWPGSAQEQGFAEIEVAVTINGKRQATVPVLLDLGRPTPGEIQKAAARSLPQTGIQPVPAKGSSTTSVRPKKTDDLPPAPVVSQGNRGMPAVENPVVVKARDSVKVIARVGPMRISTLGEALQEGRIGQNIRVRNVDSNKVLLGRVVEAGMVEIDF